MDINLNNHFQKGSGAWHVAEKLLTGKPYTRQELVGTKVSITTVNRVIQVLEDAGARFSRTVDDRQAVFQLVEVGSPKKHNAYPDLDAESKITKDELVADDHVIEFTTDQMRFRGVVDLHIGKMTALPSVGTSMKVAGIVKGDSEFATVILADNKGKARLTLEHVQNITTS